MNTKRAGAITITGTMLLGLMQQCYSFVSEIKEKIAAHEGRIMVIEANEKTSMELLKEVRNDVKLLLSRSK